MNLITFSIRTKGAHNFVRRLWTVFTRFGFSDARSQRTLLAILETVRRYGGAPTFFVPAVVLRRHPNLIGEIAACGAEIGIHGYVHNDYRSLSEDAQRQQTKQAMDVFRAARISYHGFRNPYLGWTPEAVRCFDALDFRYDSNEAVAHDVVDLSRRSPTLRSGFAKSLKLFQAIAPSAYTLRPHREGALVRIPTSIPDDEMLFDRLRITDQAALGDIWSQVMERVYALGGVYTLNLHPERGVLCKPALSRLLDYARRQSPTIWLASLAEIDAWWRERADFALAIEPVGEGRWRITATCTPRATLLARALTIEDAPASAWYGREVVVAAREFTARAERRPCVALSPRTPAEVEDFLREQGYPTQRASVALAERFALFVDAPEGLGETRAQQIERRSALVAQIEALAAPLIRFAPWPDHARAALAITGDIDSITIQDFFLRIVEARRSA